MKYFDPSKIFKSYLNNPTYKIYIVIGTKNIGKTYGFIKLALANYKKTKEKFLLIRRLAKEAIEYWDEDSANSDLWIGYTCHKNLIYNDKKEVVCRITSLNGSTDGKGKANQGYTSAIFDDFIGEQWENPLKSFNARLAKLISNFARDDLHKFKLYMTGNLNSYCSEFLNENNIELRAKGGIQILNDMNMIIYSESPFSPEGLFAVHNKDFKNTALSFIKNDNDLLEHLTNNTSQANEYCYLPLSKLPDNLRLYKQLVIEERLFCVFWYHLNIVLTPFNNLKYKETKYKLTFSPKNIGSFPNVRLSGDSKELAKFFLSMLKKRKLKFTDMRYFKPLLRDILGILSIKETYAN